MPKKTAVKTAETPVESKVARKPTEWKTATGSRSRVLQHHLINEVARTIWMPEGLPEEQKTERLASAFAMLEGIEPESEIEGMLAAQMVGTHSAAMECLRRAMLPNQTFEGRDQNLKHASKLLSLYARQLEVLDKHRGKGQQKVTVEHVHVEAGGKAIVGNVEAGERGHQRGDTDASPAIEHAPEVPLETPAPATGKVKAKG